MLAIELDTFSGNPNPSRQLSDKEAGELLDRVMADLSLVAPPQTVGGPSGA